MLKKVKGHRTNLEDIDMNLMKKELDTFDKLFYNAEELQQVQDMYADLNKNKDLIRSPDDEKLSLEKAGIKYKLLESHESYTQENSQTVS